MRINLIYIIILAILIFGCSGQKSADDNGKINIVTTTGMIYDAVNNIAHDRVEIQALMGPGVDPHLYKATQGDLSKLNNADIIFYNGLYLEGKMGEVFKKLSRVKDVLPVAEIIDKEKLRDSPLYKDAYDPHVWFDVSLWQLVVAYIAEILEQKDPQHKDYYRKNSTAYLKKLDSLDFYVKNKIKEIPQNQRVLITAHDAFGYFGDAYDIEVKGLQGISTVSEFGLKDIAGLIDLITERNIKAVFVETSVSDKAISAVVQGSRENGQEVVIGGKLYSDAMGEFGTFEGTYVGMVTHNVNTIVEALK